MKCSELWLREWVNPALTLERLSQTLTMAGLEVEELIPVAPVLADVVVSEIRKIEKHPHAEQLNICNVAINATQTLQIVCGAKNIEVGLKVPLAMPGAILPPDVTIEETTIRDVRSEGMLCSAKELGLSEDAEGLYILPADAPIGVDLRNYLSLDDRIIDISITPNRGDCLSVRGLAREIAALTKTPLHEIPQTETTVTQKEVLPLTIITKSACPHYTGRLIHKVKADSVTPLWLKERLHRSGIRSINAIVDVTNYVMLELGQPLHAFDVSTIHTGIVVRQSQANEEIALLDGSQKLLDTETLVIADRVKPLAIAGVMGGLDSSVTLNTTDIFLESVYFSPEVVAKQRQYYHLNSESAYRFERGVDPTMQREALERATQLILEIAGGNAGPIIEEISAKDLPAKREITISSEKIEQMLGIAISTSEIETIFQTLHLHKKNSFLKENKWVLSIPPYRFDLALPEDIVEEIARFYGYDKIPTHCLHASLQVNAQDHPIYLLKRTLGEHAYNEVITYSFVDKQLQQLLNPQEIPHELVNPMTTDMAVMRTNLWPGLINTLLYNKSRQCHRIRLFEIGTCFITLDKELLQQSKLSGLITGLVYPEQWGTASRSADFYDLKGDIEHLLTFLQIQKDCTFRSDSHPALHPGQTASIYHHEQKIGIMGALHPLILQTLNLSDKVFIFELDLHRLMMISKPPFNEISKFPEIRRDLAILVNQAIPAKDIQDTIKGTAGDWLKEVFIFDVYQGKGIPAGLKSIALALIFQHPTRTLIDDEVTAIMEHVMAALKGQLDAVLRS